MDYCYKLVKASVVKTCGSLVVDAKTTKGNDVCAFCGAAEVASLCLPQTTVWLKETSIPTRIVRYNVAFVDTPDGIVFANPKYNRYLFKEAFDEHLLPDFESYTDCMALNDNDNAKGIDFELTQKNGKKCFVYVMSIYDKFDGRAVFPTNVSFFEIKIFEEMKKQIEKGNDAYVVMIVPRQSCCEAKFVWNINESAAAMFFDAAQSGIKFLSYGCNIAKNSIKISHKLEILY